MRALLAIALLIGLLWPVNALALALLPTVALADIAGPARVIDGDTIEVAGQRIRLHGIDAPETDLLDAGREVEALVVEIEALQAR